MIGIPDVLLVGNGPSAVSLDAGERIDRFRTVVRFNDFVLDGWEKQLGRRTTHWAANDLMSPARHPELKAIVAVPERNRRRLKLSDWHGRLNLTTVVPPEIERRLTAKFGQPGEHGRRWPSTGLLVAAWMIDYHGAVVLHGFDRFAGVDHHYFAGSKSDAKAHVASWEDKVFSFWLKSNKAVSLAALEQSRTE